MYSATIERNPRGVRGYNMTVSGRGVGRTMRYQPVAGLGALGATDGEAMTISPLVAAGIGAVGLALGWVFGRAMK